jgi:hypothetical protein
MKIDKHNFRFDIDKELHKRFKIACIKAETQQRLVLIKAIEDFIAKEELKHDNK